MLKKCFILALLACVAVCAFSRGTRDRGTAPSSQPNPAPTPQPTPPEQPRYYQVDEQIAYYIKIKLSDGGTTTYNAMYWEGCKFMSALGVAQTHALKSLTSEQINSLRERALSQGSVTSDLTVRNVASVINMAFGMLGAQLIATDLGLVTTLDCVTVEYDSTLIWGITTRDHDHWCEGSDEGEVLYNPFPTATYREIRGYQLVRITGYRRGLQHSIEEGSR